MAGKLVAYVGSMGSGKTNRLIELYKEFTNQGKVVGVFNPTKDSRNNKGFVRSRDGSVAPSTHIDHVDDIFDYEDEYNSFDAVLIDEIQFFTDYDVISSLTAMTLVGIDVYVFGLDVTSDDETFGFVGDILTHSDEVFKLKGKCSRCGGESRVSNYRGGKTLEVVVGDLDKYEPLCRECFYLDEKGIQENLDMLEDETIYVFDINGEDFTVEIAVPKSELEGAGYTYEDVQEICTLEGANNLLIDLGYTEELIEGEEDE